jgi:hypothetical protein
MLKVLIVILIGIFLVVYRKGGLYPNMPAFEFKPAFEPIPALKTIPAPTPNSTPEKFPAPEAIPIFDPIPVAEPIAGLDPIPAPEPIPESETIPAPESLPVFEKNGALQPTQESEIFLIRTAATIKKTEYAQSWAFQRIGLSEHKDNFWMIFGPLVLSVVTIHSCLMVYRHSIRVSYRKEEEYEHDRHSPNELVSERAVKAEDGRPSQIQNEVDSVRNLAMRAEQRRLTFGQFVEEDEDEDEDEEDAHSHNDLDSVRTIAMEDEHLAHCQYERDSVRNLAMRAEQRRLTIAQFVDIMPTILEEDEDEDEDEENAHSHNDL